MLLALAALLTVLPNAHAGYLQRALVSAGIFDFTTSYRAPALRLEVRPRKAEELEDGDIFPLAGAVVSSRGGFFGYAGGCLEVQLNRSVYLSPSVGVGGYARGSGKDLGGAVEFFAAGSVLAALSKSARLGLSYLHISNAYYHRINPGSESLFVTAELEW
jgi:hypothetical protein